jgi:DNA-binding transcriptional LysR family regulator
LLADHPGLRVELVVSDRLGDMIEDRLDLAMRLGEISDASPVVRRAGTAQRVIVAAPGYIERHGTPTMPADLTHHTRIVHEIGPDSDPWSFVTPGARRPFVCPADSSPMTSVQCTWPRAADMASRVLLWSRCLMTCAMVS